VFSLNFVRKFFATPSQLPLGFFASLRTTCERGTAVTNLRLEAALGKIESHGANKAEYA
jgi:hypothetical protein